ncbi:MAG: succinate CoA transferase [Prevotellaceae bacterium]|nr:succinate CoA transferase [Candidatus Colivivens caballi]
MAYAKITAAEAAALIQNGDNIGLSGFTPAGTAKAVTAELAKKAHAEHEAGREFKVGIFTGASTGQSCDGVLSNEHAIKYRAPYTTNPDFRKHVNAGEIAYNDIHLGMMAQDLRYGFLGDVDYAIIEVCAIEDDKVWLTAAGGISPTIARLAKKGIILELNAFHSPKSKGIHDVYEPLDPPCRKPIPIEKVTDRIGTPYLQIDPKKVIGVVECNLPDEARSFKDADPITDKIGENVANFLMNEKRRGIIPPSFLPFQSGVGTTANAILFALGSNPEMPQMEIYTEVLQNAIVDLMFQEKVKCASTCSLTVTNDKLLSIYDNIDFFKDKLVLRQSEISNNAEVIRRLGLIAINTAIEVDLFGHANSTQICGTKMMNGIGGSGDFERNAFLSIFTCPSVAKGGMISSIVPFCSHIDHTEHDVNIIVTEQGVADLRGKSPIERAKAIIENCAHPDYKQLLWDYLKISQKGQSWHNLAATHAFHDTFLKEGDMHKVDFSKFA